MATVDLIPDADGGVQQWDLFPGFGESHWQDVDDPVGIPDEDLTYVHTNVNNEVEEFHHKTSNLLIGATITNVRVTVRAKETIFNENMNIGLKIGITRYPAIANIALTANYADYGWNWADNPADSKPWEKSDIDGLQSSLLAVIINGSVIRVTQVYLTVTYTPTAANPLIGKPFVSPGMIKKAIIR